MNPQEGNTQFHPPQRDEQSQPSSSHPAAAYSSQPAAADAARAQANHHYQHNPPNQLKQETAADTSPYHRTHQPTFDWQRYHTAWQSYYQQYYQRYYGQQLAAKQQELEQERAVRQTPQLAWQTITGDNTTTEPKTRAQQLRADFLAKVRERAERARKSHHFVPIISALVVGLLFLFLQYNRLLVAQVEAYVSPGSTVDASDSVIVDPATNANVGADPKIIIPKINVNVPVVYDVASVDDKPVQNALERGVVHYNLPGANSVPGQAGNTVILGHSSNDVFDPGGYKFAFVLIDRLQPGDLFYMNYQSKRYVYRVTDKKIIKPTEWRVLQDNQGKPTAVLVTCTPAGTALNRLLVYGEQISPDPASDATKPAANQHNSPATIPGNSPTFFERLRNIFF